MSISFLVQSDDESDDEAAEKTKDVEAEPAVPEPARDAQLEEAYKLEKEDAGSDEVDSDDDDDEQQNGEVVELTKEQKREAEVFLKCKITAISVTYISHFSYFIET